MSKRATGRGLTDQVVTSGVWVFSGTGVQGILRLAVLTTLARLLGPPEFGLAAAATVVIAFFRLFTETGIRSSIIQRPDLEERHLRTAFTLCLIIGVVGAVITYAIAPFIAVDGFAMPGLTPVIRAMAILLPLQSLGIVASGLLQRELRFSWVIRAEIGSYVIGYAPVGLGMAVAGYGVWSLVGAYIVQEALRTAISIWAAPHAMRPLLDTRAAREFAFFGSGFALARVGNWAALNGDKWVAGRWLGSEALGFYKYAFELTQMISTMFGQVLDKVLFPAMARVQNDVALLGSTYRHGVGLISILVLPISSVLYVLAPEVIHVVLGEGWDAAIGPFQVLSIALLIRSSYVMSDALARATGAVYRRAWRQAIYALAVVSLAWLGQRDGLTALTIGVVTGISVNFLLMARLSMDLAALSWRDIVAAHLGALPSFVLAIGVSYGVASFARGLALPDLAVIGLVATATALALLGALRISPRQLLGADGEGALELLWSFAELRLGPSARASFLRVVGPRFAKGNR
jgi:O-antigen/teichoic acid export membrane protein